MKSSLLAICAIGAEFARRIYFTVLLIVSIISVILLGISLWLVTLSNWWLILFAVFIIAVCVAFGVLMVMRLVIKSVTPVQSKDQKRQTKAFVDKLQRLSDTAQTPKFILLFRIVRDIAAPRTNGFIATISNDTTSLKRDFVALGKTFKQ